MPLQQPEDALVLDDRGGFYMVPTASIAKTRARLSGAHQSEALAALVCLARESYAQYGASREEQQRCEVNLDALATRTLGVSRARALRILDNLVDAGALTKDAHRFDGTRRLPTLICFVDLAVSFAYVSAAAFAALADADARPTPAFGPLALYVTLVALGGEQRDDFPAGKRRMARASQPELARLSGLSVSSVKRAVATLASAGLLVEQPQPTNALKTKAVYRLIDPADRAFAHATAAGSQRHRRTVHSPTDEPATAALTTAHSPTDDSPQPDRRSAQRSTDVSSVGDRPSAHSATDGQANEPSHARTGDQQISDQQKQNSPLVSLPATPGGGEEADRIVRTFHAWTKLSLGDRQAAALYDPAAWARAAETLLERYDLDRILAGIERLSRDALLADKAPTLPTFVAIAQRAITRAAADRGYSAYRQSGVSAAPSWSDAFSEISAAIRRHGEAGKTTAIAQLSERHPAFAAFIDAVGWTALCRDRPDTHQYDWKQAWEHACQTTNQEAAA